MATALECPTCKTPSPDGLVVRCAKCARVFDPHAALHPAPNTGKAETTPRGLSVARDAAGLRATLQWVDVWALRKWPAATVTLLHFVLIAVGIAYSAYSGVALLAFAVAVQFFLYARVLSQKTTVVATPTELKVERVRSPSSAWARSAVTDLMVIESAPRALGGAPLKPKKKLTRMYALCALAPEPVCLVHSLPTLAHAQVLEDAARVTLQLPPTPIDGALRR